MRVDQIGNRLVQQHQGEVPVRHVRQLMGTGPYSFTASTSAAGALRPLRDPDAPELDEDDDGSEPE